MQQHQYTDSFALAVVQPGTDQMHTWTVERMQQALEASGLVETDRGDHAVAAQRWLFQPGGYGLVVLVEAGDAMLLEVVLFSAEEQTVWLQASAAAITQVKQATTGFAEVDGFPQYAAQQGVETGFCGEAGGVVEDAGDGVLHLGHGHGQLIHFQYRRTAAGWIVEVETADRFGLQHQRAQRAHQNARHQPAEGNAQQQDGQGQHRALPANAVGLGQQFVFRSQQGKA